MSIATGTGSSHKGMARSAEEDSVTGSREWVARSACAEPYDRTRVDNWFGPDDDDPDYGDGNKAQEHQRAAKRICVYCPVRMDCLKYAMDNDIKYGIWGGMTRRERVLLRKQRAEREAGE